MSKSPRSSHCKGTTVIPAITAEAGLVPWAEVGTKQIFRCESLRASWYARMVINPAYSP